jgi:putative membrane protein
VAFAAGLGALFLALASPLDALSDALFSAHMVQHLVLVLAAAPLLLLGRPWVPLLLALPAAWHRRLNRWRRAGVARAAWRGATHPVTAWISHAAAMWVWHLPILYQAALNREPVHVLEHACFLGTALLFWWPLLGARGGRRLDGGAAFLYLVTAAVQGMALGALIAFARTAWYPAYAASAPAWGLTPLQDQQLAGLIMWVPAGTAYGLAAGAIFVTWLQEMERNEAASGDRRSRAPTAGTAPGGK